MYFISPDIEFKKAPSRKLHYFLSQPFDAAKRREYIIPYYFC